MTLSIKASLAIAACAAMTAKADEGTANTAASFTIYKGDIPASVDAALGTATPLVTMEMSNPAFAPPVDNDVDGFADAAVNAVADVPATDDGIATFYRLFNRDGVAIWQGTVSEPNQGGDMELSSVSVIANVNVVVQSFLLRVPK